MLKPNFGVSLFRVILAVVLALWCGTTSAERPQILIIGDSISLGYTPEVIRIMRDEADVRHNPGNAQHTGTGLQKLDSWLGDTKWDVIHFNWGLWDLCYRHPESKVQGRRDKVRGTLTTSLEQYEQNLDRLTARLKETGARLIWGTTTVVPEAEAGRKAGDDLKYNSVAERVMQKYGVEINDLNRLTRTFDASLFVRPGDVHFTADGYHRLAVQVATSLRSALPGSQQQKVVSRVLFGSCIRQENPVPIFQTILDQNPELFIFLGDNIYGDTEDMDILRAKYQRLGQMSGFQQLRKSCPVLATWDDHDFGVNDGGADYLRRDESQQVFVDFWYGQSDVTLRNRPGIYDSQLFGPPQRRIQVILLDTRYFRSPLKRGEKRVGGSWEPDDDPGKTMLGAAQWTWLEQQLQVPAQVRIIASSIQFAAEDAGQETWSNLPRERDRLLDLIAATQADGVLFISGDRHWSELSVVKERVPFPLFDLTSSSLNQPHPRGTPTANRFRALPKTYHTENFGVIDINWDQLDPTLTLEIRDMEGAAQLQHDVRLSEMTSEQ